MRAKVPFRDDGRDRQRNPRVTRRVWEREDEIHSRASAVCRAPTPAASAWRDPGSTREEAVEILLRTERLTLRRFEPTDGDHLFELDGDPAVMRYLSGGRATPRAVIDEEILPRFLHHDDRHRVFGFWAAIERSSGEFLGWFGLRPHDAAHPEEIALGYRLHRRAWGRGLATEGALALVASAFAEPGVERVVASTYQDNVASRRVLEKLGMTVRRRYRLTPEELQATGTFDAADLEVWDGDDLEYELTRAAWQARRERP